MKIIDCHNHSLPDIDDGAKDLDMSIEMLKIAESHGTTDIILTPHHLNGAFTNFASSVVEKTNELIAHAKNNNISINLHHGSEIHVVPETVDQILENKALTYCGLGKAALLELPKNSIPTGVESILSDLIYHGITPIIAHPERNSSLRQDRTPLAEWVDFGCKAQLTGQSCTGGFGQSLQDLSFKLISENLVHFVASDAHRPEGRNPNLSNAYTIICDEFDKEVAELLFHDNPARLIGGEEIQNLTIKNRRPTEKIKSSKTKKASQKKWYNLFR